MSIFDRDLGPRAAVQVPVEFPPCLACGEHPKVHRRIGGTAVVEHVCEKVNRSSWVNGDSESHAREVWMAERFKFWGQV